MPFVVYLVLVFSPRNLYMHMIVAIYDRISGHIHRLAHSAMRYTAQDLVTCTCHAPQLQTVGPSSCASPPPHRHMDGGGIAAIIQTSRTRAQERLPCPILPDLEEPPAHFKGMQRLVRVTVDFRDLRSAFD